MTGGSCLSFIDQPVPSVQTSLCLPFWSPAQAVEYFRHTDLIGKYHGSEDMFWDFQVLVLLNMDLDRDMLPRKAVFG